MPRRAIRLAILLSALLGLPATALAADDGAKLAGRYAALLMGGDDVALEPLHDAQMKAAMTPSAVDGLLTSLTAANGAVDRVGEAWLEDTVQGYRRYRVPVFFARATLDLRVVLDGSDRVAGLFTVPHVAPPEAVEAPCREIAVTVGGDDTGLAGLLALPDGEGPFPALLLVHGSGPNDMDATVGFNKPFRDLAWGLADRGVATLRYDKRSHARPGDLAALGPALTVQEEVVTDAVAGLRLLQQRPEVDADRVFVAGHSLGGQLAPRIAAGHGDLAGVAVLAGSALPLPEKMLAQYRYIAGLDGTVDPREQEQIDELAVEVAALRADLAAGTDTGGYRLGAPVGYFRDLEAVDAPTLLAELALPCLVLQGDRDYQVTMEDFALWQAALAGHDHACLRVLPGIDHLLRMGEGPSGPADYDAPAPVAEVVIDCLGDWVRDASCCGD